MNPFGSWTAISLSLKAWKILQRHSRQVISQYSSSFFSNNPDHLFVKLTEKGFFPYSYLDSFEKFKEPLPTYGGSWKNSLTVAIDITPSDYQHALNFYQEFGCRNLGDYHIYLKTDVFLLPDIFEKVRKVCLKFLNARSVSLLLSSLFELGVYAHFD